MLWNNLEDFRATIGAFGRKNRYCLVIHSLVMRLRFCGCPSRPNDELMSNDFDVECVRIKTYIIDTDQIIHYSACFLGRYQTRREVHTYLICRMCVMDFVANGEFFSRGERPIIFILGLHSTGFRVADSAAYRSRVTLAKPGPAAADVVSTGSHAHRGSRYVSRQHTANRPDAIHHGSAILSYRINRPWIERLPRKFSMNNYSTQRFERKKSPNLPKKYNPSGKNLRYSFENLSLRWFPLSDAVPLTLPDNTMFQNLNYARIKIAEASAATLTTRQRNHCEILLV